MKLLSRVQLLATPWTAAYQALPSMGFSRQEYWSRVPLPSPPTLPRSMERFCSKNWSLVPKRLQTAALEDDIPYTPFRSPDCNATTTLLGSQAPHWRMSGPQPAGAELQLDMMSLYLGKGKEALLLLGPSFQSSMQVTSQPGFEVSLATS